MLPCSSSGAAGLHGDFNLTGSYEEQEQARRLATAANAVRPYGIDRPDTEPPRVKRHPMYRTDQLRFDR